MLSPAGDQASYLPASCPQSWAADLPVQAGDLQGSLQAALVCLVSGGEDMKFILGFRVLGEILVVRHALYRGQSYFYSA